MESLSEDQFKLNHFKQRLAQIVVQHEEALADAAVKHQLVVQERDDLRVNEHTLSCEVAQLKVDIENLKALGVENGIDFDANDEAGDPSTV